MVPAGTEWKRRDTSRPIEDKAGRQVAFSKRRQTLFGMASDLSALSGVDTAVVVFSSPTSTGRGANAYAFGSPSVDAVLRRHVDDGQAEDGAAAVAVVEEEEDEGAALEAKRRELDETRAKVAAEKKRMKEVEAGVEQATAAAGAMGWWQADVNALGPEELPEFEGALGQFRDAILRHISQQEQEQASGP